MTTSPQPDLPVKQAAAFATVMVQSTTASPRGFRIENDSSSIIGRDKGCGIRLEDNAVSPKHCLLRMSEGKVSVTDWYSDSGTIVNGQRITEPYDLGPNDVIDVGPYQVRVIAAGEEMEPPVSQQAEATPAEPPSSSSATDSVEAAEPEGILIDLISEPAGESPLGIQLAEAREEIEQLRSELEYQISIQSAHSTRSPASGSVAEQEVELLQEEINRLQQELTQRDQELQSLAENPNYQSDQDDSETVRLVARLEELLDELHSADQRVWNLEDLLRISDEAHQAEVEERAHIENWISEIEVRLVRREEERNACEEKLKLQLEETVARCEHAESRLAGLISGREQATQRQAEEQITQLREKNEALGQRLEQYQSELNRLNQLIESAGGSEQEIADTAALQQRLREQELELAHKRAEMARQCTEMARLKDELERLASGPKLDESNADVKMRALRQHLREIHDEEKQERETKSLSSRIARIWQRLDGK